MNLLTFANPFPLFCTFFSEPITNNPEIIQKSFFPRIGHSEKLNRPSAFRDAIFTGGIFLFLMDPNVFHRSKVDSERERGRESFLTSQEDLSSETQPCWHADEPW